MSAWLAHLRDFPALALLVTMAAFYVGGVVQRRLGGNALANPVVIAIALVVVFLKLTGLDYATYVKGTSAIQMLLGPATVALAVPLYNHLPLIRRHMVALVTPVAAAALISALSAYAAARWLGAPPDLQLAILPKSVTTPIGIGIAEKIGAVQSLTVFFIFVTGIGGSMFGGALLKTCRLGEPQGFGLAMGTTCHALGVVRSLALGEAAGAFAILGMGLMGVFSAVLVPLLARLLAG